MSELCSNGEFESATTGWTGTGATLARSTAYARHGTYSLGVTATGATPAASYSAALSGATAGLTFDMGAWVFVPAGSALIGLTLAVTARGSGGGTGDEDHTTNHTLVAGVQYCGASAALTANDRTSVVAEWRITAGAGVGTVYYLDTASLWQRAGTAARPRVEVDVDWTAAGVWVAEADRCTAVTVRRGRTSVTDAVGAGSAAVTLSNQDGRYSPYNGSSPLSPNVIGGRPLRIVAYAAGVAYSLWTGVTTEYQQQSGLPAEVVITGLDAFDVLSRMPAVTAFATASTIDTCITALLAGSGWTGSTRLETGRTLDAWAPTQASVLQELGLLAQNELGGLVYMAGDGALVFENAAHRAAAPVWTTLTEVDDLTLGQRDEDLVGTVSVTYATAVRTYSGAQTLYSGAGRTRIEPYDTYTVTQPYRVPGAVTVTAPVAGTDYTATDGTDWDERLRGGNLDVSRSVRLEAWTDTGAGFTAVLRNGLPYPVYLSGLTVRGTGGLVTQQQPPAVRAQPAVPLSVATREETAAWVTDAAAVQTYATARATALGTQHPRPVVELSGVDAATLALVLGGEISRRVHLDDTLLAWATGVHADFFIEGLQLTLAAEDLPTVQWTLWHEEAAGG